MSIFEYNKEEEEKKLHRAEYEAGKEDGILFGEQRLSTLFARLIQEGKSEELQKAVTDASFRERMYEKYHL